MNEGDAQLIADISKELRTLTGAIITAPQNDPCFNERLRLRSLTNLQQTINRAVSNATTDLRNCELRQRQQPTPTPTPGPGQ